MGNVHTMEDLYEMQALPLKLKISMTMRRIRDWVNEYGEEGVYVSFSGGKDSTVLLDIVRNRCGYTKIPAVFVDTGLEYPEIREFVKRYDNVEWLKPKKNFRQVIEDYGYPFFSKDVAQTIHDSRTQANYCNCDVRETNMWRRAYDVNSEYLKKFPQYSRARYDFIFDAPEEWKFSHMCCNVMKKTPVKQYEKETGRHPILATMASESRMRATVWLHEGCNAFTAKRQISRPMSFWTEQDVLLYISKYEIPLCSVYGDIVEDWGKVKDTEGQMTFSDMCGMENCDLFDAERPPLKTTGMRRTGCMFCGFGMQNADDRRFQLMRETHPKQYDYIMRPKEDGGLNYKEMIDWINEHGGMEIKY